MNNCGNCYYWQNYQVRVFANISSTRSTTMVRNRIELRPCGFTQPPGVGDVTCIYTDQDFSCSGHKELKS